MGYNFSDKTPSSRLSIQGRERNMDGFSRGLYEYLAVEIVGRGNVLH